MSTPIPGRGPETRAASPASFRALVHGDGTGGHPSSRGAPGTQHRTGGRLVADARPVTGSSRPPPTPRRPMPLVARVTIVPLAGLHQGEPEALTIETGWRPLHSLSANHSGNAALLPLPGVWRRDGLGMTKHRRRRDRRTRSRSSSSGVRRLRRKQPREGGRGRASIRA
jgi:hypothetical protein